MGRIASDTRAALAWIAQGYLLPSGHIRASARRRLARPGNVLTPDERALQDAIAAVHREPVHSVILSADRYPDDPLAQIQIIKACVDGFGRALQTQQLVDPGEAYAVDADGSLIIENGQIKVVDANPRWRISERVEFNNKGLPVRQYRAFFADTYTYVNDQSLRTLGHHDKVFYDVISRQVRLINAKGHLSRVAYHPWFQTSEDFNDTAETPSPTQAPGS